MDIISQYNKSSNIRLIKIDQQLSPRDLKLMLPMFYRVQSLMADAIQLELCTKTTIIYCM